MKFRDLYKEIHVILIKIPDEKVVTISELKTGSILF